MADKAILDFPMITDTFDTDVIYVVRGVGTDRDKYSTKANFLSNVYTLISDNTGVIDDIITGAQKLDTLTVLGDTILARDSGDVRIGSSSNPNSAQLYVSSLSFLGGNDGDYDILLQERHSPQSNNLYRSSWLVRNGAGTTWTTAVLHDAISVDTSFLTPRVDTKCWYERDPQNSSHAWGTETTTYLKLFNTANAAIGTTIDSGPRLVVADGVGSLPTVTGDTIALFQGNATTVQSAFISIIAGNAALSGIKFGDQDDENIGVIQYVHSNNSMRFVTNTTEAGRFTSDNHLLINQTSDTGEYLQVNGAARFTGTNGYFQFSSAGNSLYVGAGISTILASLELGFARTGDGVAYIDLIGDTTYTDYGVRLIRNAGANGGGYLNNRGTGAFTFSAPEDANWVFDSDVILQGSLSVNTTLYVDTIAEKTASSGVTFTNALILNSGAADGANAEFMSSGYETAKIDNFNGSFRVFSDTYGEVVTFDTNSSGKTVTFKGPIGKDGRIIPNSLHGTFTDDDIFGALNLYLPSINDEMLISGGFSFAQSAEMIISKAIKVSSTVIRLYCLIISTGAATTRDITDGNATTHNISISW